MVSRWYDGTGGPCKKTNTCKPPNNLGHNLCHLPPSIHCLHVGTRQRIAHKDTEFSATEAPSAAGTLAFWEQSPSQKQRKPAEQSPRKLGKETNPWPGVIVAPCWVAWSSVKEGSESFLLVTRRITSNKKLLVAPGITGSSYRSHYDSSATASSPPRLGGLPPNECQTSQHLDAAWHPSTSSDAAGLRLTPTCSTQ